MPNFLVAGLLARQHGLHDDTPIDPASITMPTGQDPVHVALERYLGRMTGVSGLTPAAIPPCPWPTPRLPAWTPGCGPPRSPP